MKVLGQTIERLVTGGNSYSSNRILFVAPQRPMFGSFISVYSTLLMFGVPGVMQSIINVVTTDYTQLHRHVNQLRQSVLSLGDDVVAHDARGNQIDKPLSKILFKAFKRRLFKPAQKSTCVGVNVARAGIKAHRTDYHLRQNVLLYNGGVLLL